MKWWDMIGWVIFIWWIILLVRAHERSRLNAWRSDPHRQALVQVCLRYLELGDQPTTAKLMYQIAQASLNEVPDQWWTEHPKSERKRWDELRDMGAPK